MSTTQANDASTGRFTPWAGQSRAAGTGAVAAPPVFVVPVEDAKLEDLRSALVACDLPRLLGGLDENSPLFGAARLRRTASSTLTFGQRALRTVGKSHEAAAYVLRLPTGDPNCGLELRISLKHLSPQSGKGGSFLEIAGTTPLVSAADVQVVDKLRHRLTNAWGRWSSTPAAGARDTA